MFVFQYRLVVKTALKLLLVFVEYTEQNSSRVYESVQAVDEEKGKLKPKMALQCYFSEIVCCGVISL